MVWQRWDLNVARVIAFTSDDWATRMEAEARSRCALHPASGIDCLVFRKGLLGRLSDFAAGRPGWGNWLTYHVRRLGLPVVDATMSVTVIHQNHGYSHVPARRGEKWRAPRALRTLRSSVVVTMYSPYWMRHGSWPPKA